MRRLLPALLCCTALAAGLASAEPRRGVGAEPRRGVGAEPATHAAPSVPLRLHSPELSAPDLPFLKLGLAVAVIASLGWAVSAWSRRRGNARADGSSRIEVLARRGLGPRQQLALISVSGRRLLIGMGGDQIRLIADLSEGEYFDTALDRALPQTNALETNPATAAPIRHSVPEFVGSIGSFEGLDG